MTGPDAEVAKILSAAEGILLKALANLHDDPAACARGINSALALLGSARGFLL